MINNVSTTTLFVFVFGLLVNNHCVDCKAASKWNNKYSQTKNSNSQLTIGCDDNDRIWIGWSHYGTTVSRTDTDYARPSTDSFDMLNEYDCWMNFTEKIAEQCNGASQCDISSQPTYIHKCAKISDYIYVSYICYESKDTVDICKLSYMEKTNANDKLLITSPDFPHDYPPSVDCTCVVQSNNQFSLDVLWFSLQDNDFLSIADKRLTDWVNPTHEYPIMDKSVKLRFQTDDSLAYNGFWLKVKESETCKSDWQLVGSNNCIKVFGEALDWRSANSKCQALNGYLIKIDDVIGDLKLTQYMNKYYPEIQAYWIGLRKYVDETNNEKWMWSNSLPYNDSSWWPWKRLTIQQTNAEKQQSTHTTTTAHKNNCVIKRKHEDGFFSVSCDNSNKYGFICQGDANTYERSNTKLSVQCGQTDLINNMVLTVGNPIEQQQVNQLTDLHTTTSAANQTQKTMLGFADIDKVKLLLPLDDDQVQVSQANRNAFAQPRVPPTAKTESTKYNTTIIAGMITGVGIVILFINGLILVLCRRNLKKLIKSAKHGQSDELSQEYFDTFVNTVNRPRTATSSTSTCDSQQQPLHHHTTTTTIANNMNSKKQQLLIDNSLIDSTDQIQNQLCQQQQQLVLISPFQHEMLLRQSHGPNVAAAFKPYGHNPTVQHQYDKMSHLRAKANDFNSNYCHTYECLDTIDVPTFKRSTIQLGLNGRNFKTVQDQQQQQQMPKQVQTQHVNSFLFGNPHTTISQNSDLNFNNTTISSSDSLSANQFMRNSSMKHKHPFLHTFNANCQIQSDKTMAENHVHMDTGITDMAHSPDSAYYSSIPTSGNYTLNYNQFSFLNRGNKTDSPLNSQFV